MNIVVVTRNRPINILEQTISTLVHHAKRKHRFVIVDDHSVKNIPPGAICGVSVHRAEKQLGVGGAKNLGARLLGPLKLDELLMFSDDDFYYLDGWDLKFERAVELLGDRFPQIGGWGHPFNQINFSIICEDVRIGGVNAVAGGCQVMNVKTWEKFGPFPDNALGVGQSEDFALSRRIADKGFLVGTLVPPVAIHVGLVSSDGVKAVGYVELARQAFDQIQQLEARVEVQDFEI